MEDLGFEIRKLLVRYLAGQIPVSEFHIALAPLVWNIEKRTDPAAASLGREIELLLAEAFNGDRDEDELKEHLIPLATSYTVRLGTSPTLGSLDVTSVSRITLSESDQFQAQTQFFDRSPAKAF